MKTRILKSVLSSLMIMLIAISANGQISISSHAIRGSQGGKANMEIYLNNPDNITLRDFQICLNAPEGIEVAYDMEKETYQVEFSDLLTKKYSTILEYTRNRNHNFLILAFNSSGEKYLTGEGLLATVTLDLGLSSGVYEIKLEDIIFTYTDAIDGLTKDLMPTDVSVQLIIEDNSPVIPIPTNFIYCKDSTVSIGEAGQIDVYYSSISDVYDYKADVTMPSGVEITGVTFSNDVKVTDFTNNYTISGTKVSMTGSASRRGSQAPSGETKIATISYSTLQMTSGEYEIVIDNQFLSNIDDDYNPESFIASLRINEKPEDLSKLYKLEIPSTEIHKKRVVEVPVTFTCENPVTSLECVINLPNELTISRDESGNYKIRKGEACTDTHVINSNPTPEGIKVVIYSMQLDSFTTGADAIFYIPIEISDKTIADYTEFEIGISEIYFTLTNNFQEIKGNDISGKLTVGKTYIEGDVNGDDRVTTTDAVMTIAYVLGKNPDNFSTEAADMNGDGKISTTDAVIIIAKVLGKRNVTSRNSVKKNLDNYCAQAFIRSVQINEEEASFALGVSEATNFTGMEMSIKLPEGYHLKSITQSSVNSFDRFLEYNVLGNGEIRLATISLTNESFSSDEFAIVTIEKDFGQIEDDINVTLYNILATEAVNDTYFESSVNGGCLNINTSALSNIAKSGFEILCNGNYVTVNSPYKTILPIINLKGQTINTKISAGENNIYLPSGIYFMAGEKIIIK